MSEDTVTRLRNLLREASAEDIDWESVGAETPIADLGIDSLQLLDLLYDVEEEFGVEIDAEAVAEAPVLGDLARMVEERTG